MMNFYHNRTFRSGEYDKMAHSVGTACGTIPNLSSYAQAYDNLEDQLLKKLACGTVEQSISWIALHSSSFIMSNRE